MEMEQIFVIGFSEDHAEGHASLEKGEVGRSYNIGGNNEL